MIIRQDTCPLDGQYGQIGFLVCSDGKSLVLECNECGSIWLYPDPINGLNIVDLDPPDYILSDLGCSAKSPPARWATRQEVIDYGWADYIIDGTDE